MSDVAVNEKSNGKPKRTGGCTGKGFLPGKSGNPGGRVRAGAATFRGVLDEFLSSVHPDGPKLTKEAGREVRTRLDAMLLRLERDKPELLLAYRYGKPTEMHELTGPDGQPLDMQRDIILAFPHQLNGSGDAPPGL